MNVLAWILSGIVAGWLTGYALKREGYGILGNLLIGSIGGVVGGWALEVGLGVNPEGGWGAHIMIAMLGGVLLVGGVRVLDQMARRAHLLPKSGNGAENVTDIDAAIRKLGDFERKVWAQVLRRSSVVKDPIAEFDRQSTFGERVADRVAAFGGSWPFIGIFLLIMAIWMLINVRNPRPFDPYPFILLNLVLSCLAALQAPVIMMSQNRQTARDRIDAKNDYQVNLNAEVQILALHGKFDELRERQLTELIELQRRQLALLEDLTKGGRGPAARLQDADDE
jgi:uncharacterized membrane protein/uncharacterized membrane protein YeaQ/YmgE (transglycosylase-associated protein family)